MNAMRSRWALFMLAWILKTKAEKSGSKESMTSSPAFRGRGAVVMRKNSSRKGSTPKLVRAEPKNTGDSLPWRTRSRSKSQEAPSSSSISPMSCSRLSAPIRSARAGSSGSISVAVAARALVLEVKWITFRFCRSYTPLNSLPQPMGQFTA